MEDLGDLGNRAFAVRQLPDHRGGVIEAMGLLGLLVVDHQFLADVLGEELIFA